MTQGDEAMQNVVNAAFNLSRLWFSGAFTGPLGKPFFAAAIIDLNQALEACDYDRFLAMVRDSVGIAPNNSELEKEMK